MTYCAKLQQLSGQSTVAWHDNLVRPICGVGFRIQTGPVSPVTDNFYSFCDWTDIQLLDQQTPITLRSHCGLGSRFYLTGQTGGVQLDTTVQGVDGLTDCSDIIFSWEFLDQQLPITLRSHCGLGSRLYLTGQTGGVPLATIVQGEEGLLDCPDITLLSANTSIQGLDPCRLAGDIHFFFFRGSELPELLLTGPSEITSFDSRKETNNPSCRQNGGLPAGPHQIFLCWRLYIHSDFGSGLPREFFTGPCRRKIDQFRHRSCRHCQPLF